MLVKHVKQQPDQNDYYSSPRQEHESLSFPTCSDEKLQDSPFLYHVLQPLRECKNVNDSDTREKLVAILHVLCASVELFPLGSCWTTSAKNNWRVLSYKDDKSFFTAISPPLPPYDTMNINGCSVLDLATVVDLLGKTLEKHGNHDTSFTIVQKWTLQTLKCLTLSTDVICAIDRKTKATNECFSTLCKAWEHVWETIHSNKICYSGLTINSTEGSVGDLAVQLLTHMIKHSCIDFLTRHQRDVWNLKVFEQFTVQSSSPLKQLYTTVHRLGVTEVRDCFPKPLADINENGQRSKLLKYCLDVLSMRGVTKNDAIMSALFACIAVLTCDFSVPTHSLLSIGNPFGMQLIDCIADRIQMHLDN